MNLLLSLLVFFTAAVTSAQGIPRIEVAFVLDATGSMGRSIAQARRRIKEIASDLSQGSPAPKIRFALVRFRDKKDAYLTQVKDFTPDVNRMQIWLDATKAGGGGDTPEAVLEGLDVAIKQLSWSTKKDSIRLIYLVGDAPPQFYKNGPTIRSVAEAALAKGIVIHTVAVEGMGARGRSFFSELARYSEGRTYSLKRRRKRTRRSVAVEAKIPSPSLKDAISGSAKAYSGSVGVRFSDAGKKSVFTEFEPGLDTSDSGLLGAHVRYVSDLSTWTDLWMAHVSIHPEPQPETPMVDFNSEHVLVLGGQGEGLELTGITEHADRRVLSVKTGTKGVRFYRVSSSGKRIQIQWLGEEKS